MATSSHPVGFDDDSVTEDDSEAEDFVPWTKGHLESENQPPYSSQSYLPSRPTSLHASNGLSSPAYPADPNPITSMKRGLFHSEWNLPAPPSYADKKRKIISKQSSLPLDLDGKGRAKKPVQVGPTRKVRC
ncbi:hypothetical protein JAAARDRAFT_30920 [Jaapia argillacea MUCL 33604]|uniref:Uncharacterized protein n=1 Tax=Jaapia argillacea MUCL 33604 TaxID=933084 RepID=A0A067QDC1_9AGAM|nr:hypothetical protein JAAARDRAFT_30920 [Jaapia argillacea MUCL 33604]